MPYDWRDQSTWWPADENWAPNTTFGVTDAIARLTEVFEFASRLSQTKAGDDTLAFAVTLKKMQDRLLFMDAPNRAPLWRGYRATVDEISLKRAVPRVELVARARPIALEFTEEIFSFFGWKPAAQIMSDVQRRVLEGR